MAETTVTPKIVENTINLTITRNSNGGFNVIAILGTQNYGAKQDTSSFTSNTEVGTYVSHLCENLDIPETKILEVKPSYKE